MRISTCEDYRATPLFYPCCLPFVHRLGFSHLGWCHDTSSIDLSFLLAMLCVNGLAVSRWSSPAYPGHVAD